MSGTGASRLPLFWMIVGSLDLGGGAAGVHGGVFDFVFGGGGDGGPAGDAGGPRKAMASGGTSRAEGVRSAADVADLTAADGTGAAATSHPSRRVISQQLFEDAVACAYPPRSAANGAGVPSSRLMSPFSDLTRWVVRKGGRVNEKVAVSEEQHRRAEGAAAGQGSASRGLRVSPLREGIRVGEEIAFIPRRAMILAVPVLSGDRKDGLQQDTPPLPVARALLSALERHGSDYAPYIRVLPTQADTFGDAAVLSADLTSKCPRGAYQVLEPFIEESDAAVAALVAEGYSQADAARAVKTAVTRAHGRPELVPLLDMLAHNATAATVVWRQCSEGITLVAAANVPPGGALTLAYAGLADRRTMEWFYYRYGFVDVAAAPYTLTVLTFADQLREEYGCDSTWLLDAHGNIPHEWARCTSLALSQHYRRVYHSAAPDLRAVVLRNLTATFYGAATEQLAQAMHYLSMAKGECEAVVPPHRIAGGTRFAALYNARYAVFSATKAAVDAAVRREASAVDAAGTGAPVGDSIITRRYVALAEWVTANGGRVSPKFTLVNDAGGGGWHCQSLPKYAIAAGEELAYIPPGLAIWGAAGAEEHSARGTIVKTAELMQAAAAVGAPGDVDPATAAAAAFYTPYLDVLPTQPAVFMAMTPAECDCFMQTHKGLAGPMQYLRGLLEEMEVSGIPSEIGRRAVYSVVSRGLGEHYFLVPVFDMFNHNFTASHMAVVGDSQRGWSLVASVDIPPGAPIFYNYGSRHPDEFYFNYGFVDEDQLLKVSIRHRVGSASAGAEGVDKETPCGEGDTCEANAEAEEVSDERLNCDADATANTSPPGIYVNGTLTPTFLECVALTFIDRDDHYEEYVSSSAVNRAVFVERHHRRLVSRGHAALSQSLARLRGAFATHCSETALASTVEGRGLLSLRRWMEAYYVNAIARMEEDYPSLAERDA